MSWDYDFVVVGSGFGGSVAALRLVEKGYHVAVIEAGRRFGPGDFPATNWDLRRYLWAPAFGWLGLQRLTPLSGVMVLSGAGVGGGSLVYANTLLTPPAKFFIDPQWAGMEPDWQRTLAPHYATARQMLGVATNPRLWRADEAFRAYAQALGREAHFKPAEVGVFFGEPGVEVADPYFGGRGPRRVGCSHTGHCMIGCRAGGKNSLDRNYLYLAETLGAVVVSETTVTELAPHGEGFTVQLRPTRGWGLGDRRVLLANHVVVAAGALGSNRLLLQARARKLPKLSAKLGQFVRTNSEIINGVMARDSQYDYSQGVAITSGLWVDEVTHVEPVRYPKGSGLMLMLATFLVEGGGRVPRWLRWLGSVARQPWQFLQMLRPWARAERSTVCLTMQAVDNCLELRLGRSWLRPWRQVLRSHFTRGSVPSYLPQANAAARAIAKHLGATAHNVYPEVLLNMPLTAHILGGAVMGPDAEHGVVDKRCRAFGYENLWVVDGSIIPANLGVNPSLTITALAEYAMSQVPPRQEP